jgi:hypothetical protein
VSVPPRLRPCVGAVAAAERRLARIPAVRRRYRLPDFLGLGSAQSGSTWLFDNLGRHPDVSLPPHKELHYWGSGHWKPLWSYASWFRDGGDRCTGEVSPSYCFQPRGRIREIRALLPDVRLFYIVRNPVDREWSRARRVLGRRLAAEDRRFEDVTDAEWREYLEGLGDAPHSQHPRNIDTWRSVFPAEQLQVIVFDRLASDPGGVLREAIEHLGLRPWEPAEAATAKVNANPSGDMPPLVHEWLGRRFAPVIEEMADRYGPEVEGWRASLPG